MKTTTKITLEKNSLLDFSYIVEDTKTLKSERLEYRHTKHSQRRASQRGLNVDKISQALEYGDCFYKQGLIYYVLGEKAIPTSSIKAKDKLQNLVVIVAGNSNEVITCYRSKNPFKHIKQKSKRLSTWGQA